MRSQEATARLPGKPGSCWTATAPKTAYPRLARSQATDVVVVGAGIVGVTAACLLSQAGLSVALVEARRIGRQVTGRSTAKITTQHSLIYRHLIESFSLKTAQCYADANRLGMDQIRRWVEQFAITCAFETKDAYVYCTNPTRLSDLEAEAEASRKVGLDSDVLDRAPLPFSSAGALRSRNQAQFNPAQYLIGLAKATEAAGAKIFEETRVTSVEENEGWQVRAGQASIHTKSVVLATNLPIAGPIPYDERTRPRSHIAMAFRIDSRAANVGEVPQAPSLYIATGFNAWGISNGTAAGILIAQQIFGESPDWASIYDPVRKVPRKFNKGGDSQSFVHSLDQIEPGGGGVMNLGRGKIAVWKGYDGTPHVVSASCTHKGCIVTWNNADRTWDCPCHGSMFSADGSVIHGPAVESLPPRKLPPNWVR
jgi:glycine/D-amino acid oxidase-like deaminating enzyme/nitrite reductase/ring-hydroxylating ferredoxin subunit